MKNIRLLKLFASPYCWLVFLLMLFLGYFLVPKKIFFGYYSFLAVLFIFVFSLNATCLVRSIKELIVQRKKQKKTSLWGFLFGVIGLSALQTCAIGAPVCGVSLGTAIFSSILPVATFGFIEKYALTIVILSILVQIFSLYKMNCFRGAICHDCKK